MKRIVLTLMLCCPFLAAYPESVKWELKKDKDGIQVYSGSIPNSNIKAIKAVCTVQARLSELASLLLDAEARKQWVYGVKTTYPVKQLNKQEQVYYSEMAMPWPMTNRDAVILMKITQHPETRVMYAHMTNAEGYIAVQKEKVRVPFLRVNWTVTPVSKNLLHIEYMAQADPGGHIPAWVVNMFSTKGPFESFKALRALLLTEKYTVASVDFIED